MGDNNITDIVSSLLDGVHGISKSETIVGEPQQAGDATIIPVHRLKVAFGAAIGGAGGRAGKVGGDTAIQGAAGAVELDPVAAIAIDKDGTAHLLTVESEAPQTWAALLNEVPDLIARLARTLGERVDLELKMRGAKAAEELESGAGGEPALADKNED
jgi:uncharacterized spore protein YtfJ